jgi:hypothetical protein
MAQLYAQFHAAANTNAMGGGQMMKDWLSRLSFQRGWSEHRYGRIV